jgi:hypothetical protein
MCVSSGLKALNNTAKAAVASAQSEASSVFGAASTVFNNMIGGLQQIVNGSPSQAGFSAGELNAKNAAAVQAGATMERNLAGAAGTSAAAIGGGNAVTPAGGTQAAVLAAKTAAAQQTAQTENQIQTENFEQGNKNYWSAVGAEQNLPNVFNPATASEGQVNSAIGTNLQTQKEMDTQSNWWQPMVTAAIGGASSVATKGLMGGFGGNTSNGGSTDTSTASNAAPVANANGFIPAV